MSDGSTIQGLTEPQVSPSNTKVTQLWRNELLLEVSFGEWLKRRRLAMGLTQEQLAVQIHCSTSALRKFESEERRPSADVIQRLADLFSIPPDERTSFLRYARGDWQAISSGNQEEAPWRAENQTDPQKENVTSSLPSGTVTFLFTDIEGSTKLSQQYPEEMPSLLVRHHEILRQAFQGQNGYVFQHDGDSTAAAFHSPMDALNAASDAQRLLQNEDWSPAHIKVRMGIHTGTAQLNAPSAPTVYTGYATLATTQRIMSAGHGGQVLLSSATHELVRNSLHENIELIDLGEKRLKDLLRPEHLYQLNIAGLPTDFPPLMTLSKFRTNLPAPLSAFIGREKEKAELIDLITKYRLATLVGAGGIGKTRLSLEVAQEVLDAFSDGLWFIELAPLSEPASVPQVIINTLGLIGQTNLPPRTILTDFLQGKKTLLIFDNCEHLIQACAQLAEELLNTCPDLHILATSREGLGINGETQYIVPTLSCPDPLDATLESLSTFEAVQLFFNRAQMALPGFTMTPENASAIAQVCQRLDGIPLALELAAARLKLLTVNDIAARLEDSFRLLAGGARTARPRHQTLQALIDWSHDLLTESERVLLRRLSVFAGGWTLDAAEAVSAENDEKSPHIQFSASVLHRSEILDLLTSLVNKSLVLAEREDGQETRYHMLETIRQYANEKLWAAGEGEMAQQRHMAFYVGLAERAEPNLRSFDTVSWLDRLETEHDNIRSALGYAQENDTESLLRLASSLLWFWHIRGHKNEGIEWIERALSIEALDRGGQPMTTERALLRGKALNASGSLMVMNHEFGGAPLRLEESLTLFRGLGPAGKQGMGYALLRQGSMFPSGEIEARRALEQSLAIFREIGDRFGIAECLIQLAGHASSFAQKGDDYSQAILFSEEQLALRREIGDQDGIAVALTSLGDLVLSQDDYQKAIVLIEEGLTIFRNMKNKGAESLSMNGYGDIFFQRGDYQKAAEIYEEALSLASELGYKFIIASNLYNLGVIAWFRGEYTHAVQLISKTQPIFRSLGHQWLSATSLHLPGDITLAEGNAEGAVQWYEEALSFNRTAQLAAIHIFALEGLGKVAWAQEDYELAIKHFEEALRMSRTEDVKPAIFNALYLLGRTAHSRGDHVTAWELYAEALKMQKRRVVPLFRWASLKTYQSSISYPLAACALLATAQNNMPRAVRLFGAAETLYTALRFEMSAKERTEHDQGIASARVVLGEETFPVAWEEGKKMSLDKAISYALKED